MKHVGIALLVAVSVAAALLTTPSNAGAVPVDQEQTGTLQGTVLNTVGSALAGIAVTATSASGGVYNATTDREGTFRMNGVPPGTYEVTAEGGSAKRAVVQQVKVTAGRTVVVNFTLAPASATAESHVTYAAGIVPRSLDDGVVFTADVIDRLPKGRDILSLVPMVPGVSVDTTYTGLAFRGASAPENRYFIDGLDVTNVFTGSPAFSLVTDLVEELDVRSGGVEFGVPAATGAVVSVVTPFAGRRWRATAALHFTTDALTGNPPVGGSNDPFTTWEPAITIGGPVFGDRLSLFASYAPQLTSTQRSVASTSFTSNLHTHLTADNLTGRLGSAGRFRITALLGRTRRIGTLPPASSSSPQVTAFDWAGLMRSQPFGAFSGALDLAPTGRLALSFRGGYVRTDMLDYGVPEVVYRRGAAIGSLPPALLDALSAVNNDSAPLPTNAGFDRDVQTRLSAGGSLRYAVTRGGTHDVRVGFQYDRIANDVLAGSFGPVINFMLVPGGPTSPYGSYQVNAWLLSGIANTNRFAGFAQDTWRPSSRLTITAGARLEREQLPRYAATLPDPTYPGGQGMPTPDIAFGLLDTLAPRIGGAFDVRGDGKWIASASWGITHDPMKLDLARHYLGADIRYNARYTVTTFDLASIGDLGCLNPDRCVFPGTPQYSFSQSLLMNSFAGDLKPTTGQDMSFGLDHAIGSTTNLGVRYMRRRLVRALEDVGYFPYSFGTGSSLKLVTVGTDPVALGNGLPDAPEPRRDYDGVELTLARRLAHGWQLNASYTFSRLTGNYTAFFTPGAPAPELQYPPLQAPAWSYTSAYNSPFSMFDQTGNAVYGPLDLDRPHVIKAQLFVDLPLKASLGLYQVVASGMPISRMVSVSGQLVYYDGRLTDGRTPMYSQTDVRVQKEFQLGHRLRAEAGVNILNLFGQQATIAVNAVQGTLPSFTSPSQFFGGFDAQQLLASGGTANALYLQPVVWQPARAIRFDVRLTF